MIKFIGKDDSIVYWLAFHVLLGLISSITIYPLVFWFFLNLIWLIKQVLSFDLTRNKVSLLCSLSYLSAFEIISRMAKASPIIPYEFTKYFTFAILILAIIRERTKPNLGMLIFLLLIPAVFYDLSGEVRPLDIIFNILGPLNLGLAVWYFSGLLVNRSQLVFLLRLLILPLVSSLVFTIIKTPDYEDLEFVLGANFSTTAGFGSNQVSTVFGVSFFFVFASIYLNLKLFRNVLIEYILVSLFLFQGLVSFSRGGVMGGIISLLILFIFNFMRRDSSWSLARFFRSVLAVFVLIFVVIGVNDLSEGNLLLRYRGETSGTQLGTKALDLNTITTNRVSIFNQDISLFNEHPVLGVGAGASRYLRENNENYVAHIELSRLLAEHGFLGVLVSVLIVSIGFNIYLGVRKKNQSPLLMGIYILGVFSSFHAATRTFVTPLLLGLSTIKLMENKN